MVIENAKSKNVSMKLPYSEQQMISHLKTRVSFNDSEQLFANAFLRDNSYYRFSIFPKLLPSASAGTYSFTDSINLFYFDEFMKERLNTFLNYIEKRLKSTVNHYFCSNYTNRSFYVSQCYLDPGIYGSPAGKNKCIRMIEKRIDKSKTPAMTHHKNKPANGDKYIPLWLILEEFTFGEFNTFIKNLKSSHVKKWTKEYFAPDSANNQNYPVQSMTSWLECLRIIRNTLAHHGRIYSINIPFQPVVLNSDRTLLFSNVVDQKKRLYGALYVIKKLLNQDSNYALKNKWNIFLDDLLKEMEKNHLILEPYDRLGFDDNWFKNLHINI